MPQWLPFTYPVQSSRSREVRRGRSTRNADSVDQFCPGINCLDPCWRICREGEKLEMSQIFVWSKRFGRAAIRRAKGQAAPLRDASRRATSVGGMILIGSMSLQFCGCGGDDANTVVTPPQPTQAEAETGGEERPGGMEMPPGEIPGDTSPSPPSKKITAS